MQETRFKILEELSQNCRISTTQLAKKIRKPRHIVAYHRKQLEGKGTIMSNQLILNYEALGCTEYIIYFKIFQLSKVKEEICSFISKHPHVRWFAGVFPQFNLRVSFIAEETEDLDLFLDDLEAKFGSHIVDREVIVGKGLLKSESYATKEQHIKRPVGSIKLTKDEKEIIKLLDQNPKASYVVLANKTGLSIETIRQKIKKMCISGLIENFSAKHEATKVGHNFWCNILIKMNNLQKHHSKLQSLLYSDVKFGKTRKTFGKWNIEMTVYGKSYNDLLATVDQLENLFGDDFEGYNLQVYTENFVWSRVPKGIF